MKRKYTSLLLTGLVVLLSFMSVPSWFGICIPGKYGDYCSAPYGHLADAFLPVVSAFLLVSLVTLIFRRVAFRALTRFSLWYGGISLLIICFFLYHDTYSGGGFSPYSLLSNPIPMSWLLSVLYIAISIVFIVVSLYRSKKG